MPGPSSPPAVEPPPTWEAPPPLVEVRNLTVRFGSATAEPVVDHISFSLNRGECLALVGESGSGKTVTSRTLVGLTGERSSVTFDRLRFDGEDISRYSARTWRGTRGKRIGFVMQDALGSLDALRPVGKEIAEPLKLHEQLTGSQREKKVSDLLVSVGVPEPGFRATQYPHELSGGLRQRALIASAIACSPQLLVADEPTTALDASVGAQVIKLLKSLKTPETGLLIISHDLAVVASLADRVAVMRAGRIVEHGPVAQVLEQPRHSYTKALLAAIPSEASKGTRLSYAQGALGVPRAAVVPRARARGLTLGGRPGAPAGPVVSVRGVSKSFTGTDRVSRTVVKDVSFDVFPGETLGIVGESGSGKTTLARVVLGLEQPDDGHVLLCGKDWSALGPAQRGQERRRAQIVYQDPLSSFDPRYTVERVISEALARAGLRGSRLHDRLEQLLSLVSLSPDFAPRRPIELSGGQRQRIAVARALALEPEVLVLDEPVSALDVSVQARVLDLLSEIQENLGVAYVFISHDLGVVHHMSDRVLVMKDGAVVEAGDIDDVFNHPQDDYTKALLAAIPRVHRRLATNEEAHSLLVGERGDGLEIVQAP